MAQKIPATVITGFLGAGKTSLIRNMIEQSAGKRLAFLINEFGDLGIDREMLLGCGIEGCTEDNIVELANGCICCTVADDFLPSMQALLDRDEKPDHILIETSGLALPKPLVKAFNWPEIRAQVTVDGVITVVDSKAVAEGRFADDEAAVQAQREADDNLDHDNPLEEVFEDQLLCADMVVLNKADLMEPERRAALLNQTDRQKEVTLISALTGEGVDHLLADLDALLAEQALVVEAALGPEEAEALAWLHQQGVVAAQEMDEDGTNHLVLKLDDVTLGRFRKRFAATAARVLAGIPERKAEEG